MSQVPPISTAGTERLRLLEAGLICDGHGWSMVRGMLVLRGSRIVACGGAKQVREALRTTGLSDIPATEDWSQWVICPGFVNAHVHLNLAAIESFDYPGDFGQWVRMLRKRMSEAWADSSPAQWMRRSVMLGLQQARNSGTLRLTDVTDADEALKHPQRLDTMGCILRRDLELIGQAPEDQQRAADIIEQALHSGRNDLGLQPHAPYSTSPTIYRMAHASGLPCSTHLAEMFSEREFVAGADGPWRTFLEALGKWHDALPQQYCEPRGPVFWMDAMLRDRPWMIAHGNVLSDAEIEQLAQTETTVIYCPRASAYFGHENHPYRRLLAAGVNVALGTDSALCHGDHSILREMQWLYRHDAVDPELLLQMATRNGAMAMGHDPQSMRMVAGSGPGLIALRYDPSRDAEPWQQILCDAQPTVKIICDPLPAK